MLATGMEIAIFAPRRDQSRINIQSGCRKDPEKKVVAGIVSRILSSFPSTAFAAARETRMIIFLGRRLPGASSDLPGSRDGPGRSVCIGRQSVAANRFA